MAFRVVQHFQSMIKAGCTKPRSHCSVLGIIADLARSKPQVSAEHVRLRQQLIVLHRSGE
jgi:hypothetical protein